MDNIKLQHLLELSEQMLLVGLNNVWDDLNHLQVEHGALAREVFVGVDQCSQDEREQITKIISLTAQVVNLVEQNKTDIAEQLKQLKKSNWVQNAYLQNLE